MNVLSELSQFVESDSFKLLDQETRKEIVSKLLKKVEEVYNNLDVVEDNIEYYCRPRKADLFHGLIPIKMPRDRKVKWILSSDIQPLISVIRSNDKYGLFRPKFNGMGGSVSKYYSTPNPFRYDDVMICVPKCPMGDSGYLATLENGEWSILVVDIHSHPLKMVEGCNSFDEAKCKMEEILGEEPPCPWMTFDQVKSIELNL